MSSRLWIALAVAALLVILSRMIANIGYSEYSRIDLRDSRAKTLLFDRLLREVSEAEEA